MTFVFRALQDKPFGLYAMDDTTPLQDYSPYAGTATTSGGTPTQHSALVKGTAWAPVFTNSITATYACPVFNKNQESRPFSLEAWIRTVENSPSTTATRTNLVPDPSLESSDGAWIANAGTTTSSDTTQFVFSTHSVKFITTTENWGYYPMDGAVQTGMTRPNHTVGNVYTASIWVRANTAQNLCLLDYGDSNTQGASVAVAANTWTRLSVTFTAGTNVFISVRDPARTVSVGTIYIDGFMIEAGSTLRDYFDGSFSGATWAGTANLTTSSMTATRSAQKVLSHTDAYDGITINGTVVSFTTTYTTAPAAVCSFDMQLLKAAHVVGVHTLTKNSLYVNGAIVSETVLTDVQQADTFATSVSNLITGTTTSSQGVAINGVAFYAAALSEDIVKAHFDMGRLVPGPKDITLMNFGDYIPLDLSNNTLFLDQTIDSGEEWNHGLHDNTTVVDEELVPTQDASGTSVASRWYYSIDLATTSNSATVYGVQLDWNGIGATVAVSLNGTTWENVSRGVNCTAVPAGTTTSGKVLQIRITFAGGTVNDTSYVESLNIVGMRQAASNVASGRTITPTGASPERDHDFLEYHDNHGIMIPPGATVLISADVLGASVTRTIELLIKRSGVNPTLSLTGTNYINGAAGSATLLEGQWLLWHVVLAADSAAALTITGSAQVAYVGVYDYALTAGQVAAIYADYVGTDAPRIADASIINVSESATAANIYQHDWAISASG